MPAMLHDAESSKMQATILQCLNGANSGMTNIFPRMRSHQIAMLITLAVKRRSVLAHHDVSAGTLAYIQTTEEIFMLVCHLLWKDFMRLLVAAWLDFAKQDLARKETPHSGFISKFYKLKTLCIKHWVCGLWRSPCCTIHNASAWAMSIYLDYGEGENQSTPVQ